MLCCLIDGLLLDLVLHNHTLTASGDESVREAVGRSLMCVALRNTDDS